jgi:hypothetical protein
MAYNHYTLTSDVYEITEKGGIAWISEQATIKRFNTYDQGLKFCRKPYGLPLDRRQLEASFRNHTKGQKVIVYSLVNDHTSQVMAYYTKEEE